MPDPIFAPSTDTKQERNWVPMAVGLALVVLIVIGVAILGRDRSNKPNQEDPYSSKLQVTAAHVSAADNFVGSTVTYIDVDVMNTGDKTVVGGQVQATFHNTLNEVVQNETTPIRVLQKNQLGGYDDVMDPSMSPIGPGQKRTLRLNFEHISAEWNQAQPDLKFVNLKLK